MRNKRKGILMACAILGSAAIVSTGFAAWVITINDTASVQGNIQVDEVSDKSLFIEEWSDADHEVDANVMFGSALSTSDSDWLKGSEEVEDLHATFFVKVTIGKDRVDEFDANGGITAALTCTEYTTAETANLVDAMPTEGNGISITEIDRDSELVRYYQIDITFKWGKYFDNVNPTVFYNRKGYDAVRSQAHSDGSSCEKPNVELLKDVQETIINGTAYTGLKGAKFTLTISAEVDA